MLAHACFPHFEYASIDFTKIVGNWQFSICFWGVWDGEHGAFGVLQDKVVLHINCCWVHTPNGNSKKEYELIFLLLDIFVRS